MTNCSFCHNGEVNGRDIPGLGSRMLRLNELNNAVVDVVGPRRLQREDDAAARCAPPRSARRRRGAGAARGPRRSRSAGSRSGPRGGNAFGGMKGLNGGPGRNSAIEFAKAASKVPIAPPYSYSKYPAVWVYGKRSTFGYDGSIVGDRAMALSAVEFNKLMPPKDLVKRRDRWESVYAYLARARAAALPGRGGQRAGRKRPRGASWRGAPAVTEPTGSATSPTSTRRKSCRCPRSGRTATACTRSRRSWWRRGGTGRSRATSTSSPPRATWRRRSTASGAALRICTTARCRRSWTCCGRPNERPTEFYVGAGTDYDLDRLGLVYAEDAGPDGRRVGLPRLSAPVPLRHHAAGNFNGGHDFGSSSPPTSGARFSST